GCPVPALPTTCGVPSTGCGTPCAANSGCVSVCQGFECITMCTTQAACKLATITCPAGQICKVECAKDACEGATIECGGATECKVQCKDDHACKNVKINCGTGPCSVSCEGHDHACGENTQLKCGTQACTVACNGFKGPSVTCSAACSGCPKACP
ncbi:MAG: hypothetical protein L6Q84_33390, partial [Polyangiaceae bacterium]|nr:hypothetical protein [Polyangiaceae bacterium]